MTWVALALAAGYPLMLLAFLGYARSLVRPYQRREDAWADRVMHLAEKPWTPAPVDTWQPEPEPEPELERLVEPDQELY